MKKPIIAVAGGGHGGIACASILAKKGYDVTVYEKNKKSQMGYDWTDIFDPKSLAVAGIPMPDKSLFEKKVNMTFYSTDCKTPIKQNVPDEACEIKMERRDIYKHIITHALKCGVKFKYQTEILKPIMLGNRVVGFETSKGKVYADLIIDACGIDSPIRKNLPSSLGIQKESMPFEKFYVYRAFFNKNNDADVKDKYKVYMLPEGITGIGWVATEDKYADLLIGRFKEFDIEEVNRTAQYFKSENEVLGSDVLRGGQFVKIPVRQPLSLMVADGYAAIGDSAYMTVPIIGSGIANSFRSASILANAIIADSNNDFSAESLWNYQRDFYKKLGNGLAVLACVKLLLAELEPKELDYIFAHNILTADDMTITADDTSLGSMFSGISFQDISNKVKYVCKDKALLSKILKVGKRIANVTALTATMPKEWNDKKVKLWAVKYEKAFRL